MTTKAINYPLIYEALYLKPLLIDRGMFHSIHSVVFPRILSGAGGSLDTASIVNASQGNDRKSRWSGRRPGYVGAIGTDNRFYWSEPGKEHVAIVPVYGILAKNASWIEEMCMGIQDIQPISTAVQQALRDPEIQIIAFDIASPGGQSTGIPELGGAIAAAGREKRTIAFTDERMASAAYWLASQTQEIYATPSSTVGSIGTYLAWLDESLKLEREGYRLEFFGEGKHKGMGLPGKPLSREDRELLKTRVKEVNDWFKLAVVDGRGAVEDSTMQGQTFTGLEASRRNLTDGIVQSWEDFLGLL